MYTILDMEERITRRLASLEADLNVRIVYACESGSRAWGFPSADSDYDVRFLYLRPSESYLSIQVPRDVIECPPEGELDISGWDLKKALGLFAKSNPPLLEWLGSPIVYLEKSSVAAEMRKLLPVYYSPKACMYHYFHMAHRNYREYLKGDEVWTKKYLYVLRPLLAVRWIEQGRGVVPTEFHSLLSSLIKEPLLKREIDRLLEAKKSGAELDRGPRIDAISDFIENEIVRWQTERVKHKKSRVSMVALDHLFRKSLREVWEYAG
ncbi:MAG: nucleotidyltransferase domain-containing protein [Deltaproteobacteria bacterium]|nr:nucleotidyltransferase domain-containing protein [Deltaproteobacteria bacterium]